MNGSRDTLEDSCNAADIRILRWTYYIVTANKIMVHLKCLHSTARIQWRDMPHLWQQLKYLVGHSVFRRQLDAVRASAVGAGMPSRLERTQADVARPNTVSAL